MTIKRVNWYWRPWRWYWQTYESPSGNFRMVWRGPKVTCTYRVET